MDAIGLKERLSNEFAEGVNIVVKAGYPDILGNDYTLTLDPKLKTTLGYCVCHRKPNTRTKCEIKINQNYYGKVSKDIRMNTIVHEICHSVAYCAGDHHGPKWKAVAASASKFLALPITRTASQNAEKYQEVKQALSVGEAKYQIECKECHWGRIYYKASKMITAKKNGEDINARFLCPICKKKNWKVLEYGKEI